MIQVLSHCYGDYVEQHLTMELPRGATARMLFLMIPWIIFVLHFQDLEGAIALNSTKWWQIANPIMVATIGLYVQVFFLRRLWVVSMRNIWHVLPIAVVLVVG
ncbi:hypothetical protein LshimejAT787_1802200 [Lyophyllum shimeji]|uniref:Uncharacterized protein n=1 Tax=Lyophyllum shimeji TaxID=47721 RepID=A0A9P3Q0G3_LYOSH|nr:hypothetical protein LshimejAT787_1802200 [Lyophyllum shimeji]